jgi:hypothetical protein
MAFRAGLQVLYFSRRARSNRDGCFGAKDLDQLLSGYRQHIMKPTDSASKNYYKADDTDGKTRH